MSEAKTQCIDCGVSILQRTADEHDGRCVPCQQTAAWIPPDDFEIAPDLTQRLASINEDPMIYRSIPWHNGVEFLRFVEKLEEQYAHYQRWSPLLHDFAKRCREEHPPPTDASLSRRDRQLQRIYAAKLEMPRVGRKNKVAICRMPLVGISVAHRNWSRDESIVLLTPEEESKWKEIYSHPEDAFRWFSYFWWSVDHSPERPSTTDWFAQLMTPNWDENDIPRGHSPWIVTVGYSLGRMLGRGSSELWSWNGRQAAYVKDLPSWIS